MLSVRMLALDYCYSWKVEDKGAYYSDLRWATFPSSFFLIAPEELLSMRLVVDSPEVSEVHDLAARLLVVS